MTPAADRRRAWGTRSKRVMPSECACAWRRDFSSAKLEARDAAALILYTESAPCSSPA